jgi:general secretion pathway protein K
MTTATRRGFALMAALALLVLISVVALGVNATARPRRIAVAASAERLAATTVATGGIEHARAILTRLEPIPPGRLTRDPGLPRDPWRPANGLVIGPRRVGAYEYRVELRDAYSRLNLNGASEDQLRRLLRALRIDARQADRIAQSIADWRDHDELRRLSGAERAEYLRAGAPRLPDDAAFDGIGTLQFVHGMTAALYDSIAPYLTVVGDGGVNVNAAPRPVLLALPGMSDDAASAIIRARAAGRPLTDFDALASLLSSGARQQLRVAMPQLRNFVTFETREMQVTSVASQPGARTRVQVDAIISRDAGGHVTWRRVAR